MLRPMSALRIERDGPLLRVTLARPERRNAFDAALIAELREAFADVGDVRAVVLAGDGPSFCAGADVDWQRSAIDLSYDENVEDAMRLYAHAGGDRRLPRAGGGARAGLRTRRRLGPRRLRRRGDRGARRGLRLLGGQARDHPGGDLAVRAAAHRRRARGATSSQASASTPPQRSASASCSEVAADLDAAVERVVGELLSSSPQAVREAKKLVRERPSGEDTAHIAARLRTSEEGQDGLRAFLERRSERITSAPSGNARASGPRSRGARTTLALAKAAESL